MRILYFVTEKSDNYNAHLDQSLEECLSKYQALINYAVKRFDVNDRAAANRISKEDLRSEAKLGFIVAFKNYTGDNAFSTYAYRTMYGYLQNMVNLTLSNGPTFPHKVRALARKIKYKHPHSVRERDVQGKAIQVKYNVTCRTLKAAYDCLDNEDSLFMYQSVKTGHNRRRARVETILGARDDVRLIEEEIMDLLTERERVVLKLKLKDMGPTDIAKYIGITRPTIYKDLKSIQDKTLAYYADSGIDLSSLAAKKKA